MEKCSPRYGLNPEEVKREQNGSTWVILSFILTPLTIPSRWMWPIKDVYQCFHMPPIKRGESSSLKGEFTPLKSG